MSKSRLVIDANMNFCAFQHCFVREERVEEDRFDFGAFDIEETATATSSHSDCPVQFCALGFFS